MAADEESTNRKNTLDTYDNLQDVLKQPSKLACDNEGYCDMRQAQRYVTQN